MSTLAPVYYRGPTLNGHLFATADEKSLFIYPTLALALEAFRRCEREYFL